MAGRARGGAGMGVEGLGGMANYRGAHAFIDALCVCVCVRVLAYRQQ